MVGQNIHVNFLLNISRWKRIEIYIAARVVAFFLFTILFDSCCFQYPLNIQIMLVNLRLQLLRPINSFRLYRFNNNPFVIIRFIIPALSFLCYFRRLLSYKHFLFIGLCQIRLRRFDLIFSFKLQNREVVIHFYQ